MKARLLGEGICESPYKIKEKYVILDIFSVTNLVHYRYDYEWTLNKGANMAGLAKLGGKARSSEGGKQSQKKITKRKESFYERAYRLKKELPWPYDALIDLKNKKKGD